MNTANGVLKCMEFIVLEICWREKDIRHPLCHLLSTFIPVENYIVIVSLFCDWKVFKLGRRIIPALMDWNVYFLTVNSAAAWFECLNTARLKKSACNYMAWLSLAAYWLKVSQLCNSEKKLATENESCNYLTKKSCIYVCEKSWQ